MIGTEGYSPPEQYRGEAGNLADIYALGATLHHLLTLRDPRLEAPFSFAERPIRQINPAVSPEVEKVINIWYLGDTPRVHTETSARKCNYYSGFEFTLVLLFKITQYPTQ